MRKQYFAKHWYCTQPQREDNLEAMKEMEALMIVLANESQSNNSIIECCIIPKCYSN
jgi:hypothetical protein